MKRTTKINDLTLRPYNARVSPKFTVEVTFTHDALGDGYVNEVSQELTRSQEGDEDLPRWQRRQYHRRSDSEVRTCARRSRRSWLGPPGED